MSLSAKINEIMLDAKLPEWEDNSTILEDAQDFVIQKMIEEMSPSLDDDDFMEFEQMMDDQEDIDKIDKYLSKKIPNYQKHIEQILEELKQLDEE